MAPTKFGLFKSRSREQPEQPSTENLLESNNEVDHYKTPDSPVPSTSKGFMGNEDMIPAEIFSILSIDDDDDDEIIYDDHPRSRPASQCSKLEEQQIDYHQFQNPSSGTSTSTLEDLDQLSQIHDEPDTIALDEDASTTYDANSIQFDESSIADSEDVSMYCAMLKKPKKSRSKEQQLTDLDMWQASNVEVMQNLLRRSGTLDEQIKWEAIATSRGLCTLTDSCTCDDCTGAKYLAGVTDGDGGLGAAPLLTAINVGCQIQ
ncbi:uncharacterized protein LOC123879067 [Maniola jurtina]|uniref:uncharacterized protein LOC123879067 n=1 Tax=Maniola jurtina TaxID=191418 RepID=UPI001E685E89|nr:uncharacterized protein LOC123879067 [Maniola jurtina]XP_045782531.1 uncharacterized protein LOC123879067 [Maniola jurtina]